MLVVVCCGCVLWLCAVDVSLWLCVCERVFVAVLAVMCCVCVPWLCVVAVCCGCVVVDQTNMYTPATPVNNLIENHCKQKHAPPAERAWEHVMSVCNFSDGSRDP